MEPVQYSIDEETHIAFARLHFDANGMRGLLILGVFTAALGLAGFLIGGPIAAVSVMIGGLLALAVAILSIRFFFLPRNSAKIWREYALIKEPMTLTMGEAEFSIDQPSGHVRAKWADIVSWDESNVLFAIYINAQMAYALPKKAVGKEHIDYARQRLIASGLVRRRKRRK